MSTNTLQNGSTGSTGSSGNTGDDRLPLGSIA